jgi:hypothetical protein
VGDVVVAVDDVSAVLPPPPQAVKTAALSPSRKDVRIDFIKTPLCNDVKFRSRMEQQSRPLGSIRIDFNLSDTSEFGYQEVLILE